MKFWKISLRSPRSLLLPRLSSPSSPSLSSQQRGSSPRVLAGVSSGPAPAAPGLTRDALPYCDVFPGYSRAVATWVEVTGLVGWGGKEGCAARHPLLNHPFPLLTPRTRRLAAAQAPVGTVRKPGRRGGAGPAPARATSVILLRRFQDVTPVVVWQGVTGLPPRDAHLQPWAQPKAAAACSAGFGAEGPALTWPTNGLPSVPGAGPPSPGHGGRRGVAPGLSCFVFARRGDALLRAGGSVCISERRTPYSPRRLNSQNGGVGRDLWGPPSPTPCPSRVTQSR